MISITKLDDLWAKSPETKDEKGESLVTHTLNVVAVSKKICNSLPFDIAVRRQIAHDVLLCAALHDAGKAALGFQLSVRGAHWGRRHEMLSFGIASAIAEDLGNPGLFAIATHHKSIEVFEDFFLGQQIPSDKSRTWLEMVADLFVHREMLLEYLYVISSKANVSFNMGRIDRIVSRTRLKKAWFSNIFQADEILSTDRYNASLLRGLLITADHIASAHQFDLPEIPIQSDYIPLICRQELKGEKRPFQQRCGETQGDAILKAPTGSGKTAAILLWAANNQVENGRLFYVLPHTASINAMHKRLQNIYGKKPVGVLHHKNAAYLFKLFENDYSSIDAAKMARTVSGLARELYHPIRVTTPHQILRVALKGKGWELGLAEFPNACFVFDEIHAFEPLLVGLTIATIKWLKSMGAKVLFASATLPSFLERILQDELGILNENIITPIPEVDGDKEVLYKIRHDIAIRTGSLLSNIDSVIDEIESSKKTALIVCNHVATSQMVYKKTKERIRETILLHARFNSEDRNRIESAIQGDRPPRVLVATQAVEVSLDLDYDCGYIEPAPADALGQRLGRINRKGSRPVPAKVMIFEEPSATARGAPLYLPYDKEVTKETIRLLRQVNLLTEQNLTAIVNKIYGDGYQGDSRDDYIRGLKNPTMAKFNEDIIAGTCRLWIEDVIEGSEKQIEVLPMELYDQFMQLMDEKQYLKAKLLLVPLQMRQFQRSVIKDNALGEYTTTLKYSSDYGLDLNAHMESIF